MGGRERERERGGGGAIRQLIAVNVEGCFYKTCFLMSLAKREKARVIIISSMGSEYINCDSGIYDDSLVYINRFINDRSVKIIVFIYKRQNYRY